MAQLWDKEGFVGHLRSILDDSGFDAADHKDALRRVNAALQQGRLEFRAGRYDRAAHHLSLAVAIFFEKNAIEMPEAIAAVQLLAECFHRFGQLSYAFTAYVLLTELAPAVDSDVEATKREYLQRMAEIAGEAERDHIARFDDAAERREEVLDLLAGSMRDGDNFLALKYGYDLLKHQVRMRGEDHLEVACTAVNLSTACLNLGLYRSGARFARQALSILNGDPGARAEVYAVASFNLGHTLTSEGRVDEARECLQRSLEVAQSSFGPDDDRTCRVREAIEDLRRPRSADAIVPGQPHEVVRRPDGSTSHYFRGLPDDDDIEEVIRLGEAMWRSGILAVDAPAPPGQAPLREDAPPSGDRAKRVPDFPPFRGGNDATSRETSGGELEADEPSAVIPTESASQAARVPPRSGFEMTAPAEIGEVTAVDLSRIRRHDLHRNPRPISEWPTARIRLEEAHHKTCIASWRRDVESIHAVSRRLSGCVWDAIHLGFSYMLCDMVTLPQGAPDLSLRLITFNQLYRSLHAVLAHNVDPDLRRSWIKAEARNILLSPTALDYVFERWTLDIPLLRSLTLRQICRKRLGIQRIDTGQLHQCDGDIATLRLQDLGLLENVARSNPYLTLNLDRRHQTFASDALLIYEIASPTPRLSLIAKLHDMRSNCVAVPALVLVWAMIDGLAVSVRGCDWPATDVIQQTHHIIECACRSLDNKVRVRIEERGTLVSLSGALEGTLRLIVKNPPATHADERIQDIFALCRDAAVNADDPQIAAAFLEACVSCVRARIDNGELAEPAALGADASRYALSFDDADHHDFDGTGFVAGSTTACGRWR